MRGVGTLLTTLAAIAMFGDPSLAGSAWPPAFRKDANLYDVCFVDAQTGWAVGDRGTIHRTSDGGQQWHLQESHLDCRLESIHFVDAQRGWAVGGYTVPYTHRAKGVVLHTNDGGQHWELLEGQFLPWLTYVQFLDQDFGYAVGLTSAMFPSAVFHTTDGGKHWTPLPGSTMGCIHAQFGASGDGLVVERNGQITKVDARHLKRSPHASKGSPAKRLHQVSPNEIMIIGQRGYVGSSVDGGNQWETPPSLSTQTWTSQFDWSAIDVLEQDTWIAGIPGTRVLHTADGGASWQSYVTGQSLPLFALEFADSQHGWAVGALGTILATDDGGKTWRRQTDAPRRVAVCAVASQTAAVPWQFLSQASAGEGFLCAVEVLSGPSPKDHASGTTPLPMRIQEATAACSGALANIIQALPETDAQLELSTIQIKQRWDHAIGGDSEAALTEYLVRQFRMVRPEMIVIGDQADSPAHKFIHQIVQRAIDGAGDASQFPDQIELAGLRPWTVPLAAERTASASGSTYRVAALRLALPVGRSVQTLSDRARSLVSQDHVATAEETLFEITRMSGPHAAEKRRRASRLFDTASLVREDPMHRTDLALQGDFRQLHQHAQRRRTIESLLQASDELSPIQLQQVSALSQDLPDSDRGALLFLTAKKLASTSHHPEAFALLDELTSKIPEHPLSEAARIQQFTMTASLEGLMHWQLPSESSVNHLQSSVATARPEIGVRPASLERPASQNIQESSVADPETRQHRRQERERLALKMVGSIQSRQPDLYFEPIIRFPLASLQWRLGRKEEAAAFWRGQMARQNDSYWTARARIELDRLKINPRHPPHACRLTKTRPRLDGLLDNAAWTGAPTMQLQPDSKTGEQRGTEFKWAWDAEFLYIAGRCHASQPTDTEPRPRVVRQRDSDLTGHDRVELRLDIDRDYTTHWRLVIDRRGWATDALNEDRSWNPTWYIATHAEETNWTFEAAIPWAQISPQPPKPGEVWAIGVRRHIPQEGTQVWRQSLPGSTESADLGLLIFD